MLPVFLAFSPQEPFTNPTCTKITVLVISNRLLIYGMNSQTTFNIISKNDKRAYEYSHNSGFPRIYSTSMIFYVIHIPARILKKLHKV